YHNRGNGDLRRICPPRGRAPQPPRMCAQFRSPSRIEAAAPRLTGEERCETWLGAERVQPRVAGEVCPPTGSILLRALELPERRLAFPEGEVHQRQLVAEEGTAGPLTLELLHGGQCPCAITRRSVGAREASHHDG